MIRTSNCHSYQISIIWKIRSHDLNDLEWNDPLHTCAFHRKWWKLLWRKCAQASNCTYTYLCMSNISEFFGASCAMQYSSTWDGYFCESYARSITTACMRVLRIVLSKRVSMFLYPSPLNLVQLYTVLIYTKTSQ